MVKHEFTFSIGLFIFFFAIQLALKSAEKVIEQKAESFREYVVKVIAARTDSLKVLAQLPREDRMNAIESRVAEYLQDICPSPGYSVRQVSGWRATRCFRISHFSGVACELEITFRLPPSLDVLAIRQTVYESVSVHRVSPFLWRAWKAIVWALSCGFIGLHLREIGDTDEYALLGVVLFLFTAGTTVALMTYAKSILDKVFPSQRMETMRFNAAKFVDAELDGTYKSARA